MTCHPSHLPLSVPPQHTYFFTYLPPTCICTSHSSMQHKIHSRNSLVLTLESVYYNRHTLKALPVLQACCSFTNSPSLPCTYRLGLQCIYSPSLQCINGHSLQFTNTPSIQISVYGAFIAPVYNAVIAPVYSSLIAPVYSSQIAPVYSLLIGQFTFH